MAKNESFLFLKSKKSIQNIDVDQVFSPEFTTEQAHSPMMVDQIKLLLELHLLQMPKQRRTVFEMSRFQGLSNDEIAQKLNISKRTVGNHIYNAMHQLKKLLFIAALMILGSIQI